MFFRFCSWLGLVLALGGCAAALDKKAESVDLSKESIVVYSLDLINEFKPGSPAPYLRGTVSKLDASGALDRTAAIEHGPMPVDRSSNSALVARKLTPGRYTIHKIEGRFIQVVLTGTLDFTVDTPFDVAPNSVIYLGHLSPVTGQPGNQKQRRSSIRFCLAAD